MAFIKSLPRLHSSRSRCDVLNLIVNNIHNACISQFSTFECMYMCPEYLNSNIYCSFTNLGSCAAFINKSIIIFSLFHNYACACACACARARVRVLVCMYVHAPH